MRLICEKEALHTSVQIVSRAVSGRSTLPILNNILLKAEKEVLKLTATDLEIGMTTSIPAQIKDPGTTTIPAKLFLEVTSALPAGEVSLNSDEKNIVKIECGKSRYTLHGLDPSEFPMISETLEGEEVASFSISQSLLRNILKQTIFAASRDEARAILTGALFSLSPEEIKIVTTDTHRLALKSAKIPLRISNPLDLIIPARALSELSRVFSPSEEAEAKISLTSNQVQFKLDNITLISRLIEGQFPAYEKVIPTDYQRRLTLDREQFLSALRRASILAREEVNKIILKVQEDTLVITAESAELGSSYEELPIQLEGEGIEIAFNSNYLTEVLSVLDSDEIYLELRSPTEAGVIKYTKEPDYDYIYIVMPMQILA